MDSSGTDRGLKCDAHQFTLPLFQQDNKECGGGRTSIPVSSAAKKKGKDDAEMITFLPHQSQSSNSFSFAEILISLFSFHQGLARWGCHSGAGGAGSEAGGAAHGTTGCWPDPTVWVSSSGVLPTYWKCFQTSCSENKCLGNKTVFLPLPPTHAC